MRKIFSLMLLLATATAFTSCGGDDDKDEPAKKAVLTQTSYTMYHEDEEAIKGTMISGLAWNSDDEFVATAAEGIISGGYVGTAKIKSATGNLSFTVEVKPRYHTFDEPFMEWGATKATVKAKCGTPEEESTSALLYSTGNSKAPYVMYSFTNGKLTGSGVVCRVLAASDLADFLLERYVPISVDEDDYTAVFAHCYGKRGDPQVDFGVGMSYNSTVGGILVLYVPYDGSKSRADLDGRTLFDGMDFDSALKSFRDFAF